MKLLGAVVFAACAFVAMGCGNQDSGIGTEQANNACPTPPARLTGTTQNGDKCETFADCAPMCCTCAGTSGYMFLASECHHAKCETTDDTCINADTAGLCP